MDVNIGEIVSTVHAVDDQTLLTPEAMERIVAAVLRAVRQDEQHRQRIQDERRIAGDWDEARAS
jgi:hypothetical protein